MKTRSLVLTAMLLALSFIGANIKIFQSIAFDSMPGFLAALAFGPAIGALIGAVGHFLTAVTSGFPFGLPVHLLIMVDMALTMYAFGFVYKVVSKRNRYIALALSAALGTVLNGPVSILMIMPILGKGILVMLPVLSAAALVNILIAHAIYRFLPERIKQWILEK